MLNKILWASSVYFEKVNWVTLLEADYFQRYWNRVDWTSLCCGCGWNHPQSAFSFNALRWSFIHSHQQEEHSCQSKIPSRTVRKLIITRLISFNTKQGTMTSHSEQLWKDEVYQKNPNFVPNKQPFMPYDLLNYIKQWLNTNKTDLWRTPVNILLQLAIIIFHGKCS